MGFFGKNTNELKCTKCGTVLPDSDRLKKHQEKAHNKKKEKCRVCGTEFYTPDDLRKHKKNCK
jgi:ribosomal protein S27E